MYIINLIIFAHMVIEVETTSMPDIITIQQLAHTLGVTPNSLYSLTNTNSKTKDESFLDVCYPYKVGDEPGTGPKFIVKNEKFDKYFAKAQVRSRRPINKKETVNNQTITDFVRKMFRTHLDKNVEFDEQTRSMAAEIDSIYSRREIEVAFKNLRESAHANNNYKLITLDYMMRSREVAKWSKI